MLSPHEIEEQEFGRGSRLWDADPEVCCAAFQLGACQHTEGQGHGEEGEAPASRPTTTGGRIMARLRDVRTYGPRALVDSGRIAW